MATRIFKYPLEGPTTSMPLYSKVIHADLQRGVPTIWVECDPSMPSVDENFVLLPTGADVPDGFKHVRTFLTLEDNFVLHLYQKDFQRK